MLSTESSSFKPSASDLKSVRYPVRLNRSVASVVQLEDAKEEDGDCAEDREHEGPCVLLPPESENSFEGTGEEKRPSNHLKQGPITAILNLKKY